MNFSININLDNQTKIYKGDTIVIQVDINESIADWEIRAEIYDLDGNATKIASSNVTGGSSDEVTIDDEAAGTFTLTFAAGATTDFEDRAFLEIERTTLAGNKKTIFNNELPLNNEKITWTSAS